MKFRSLMLAVCLLVAGAARVDAAASISEMNVFLQANRPALVEILTRIHAHAMTPDKRFLVVSVGGGRRYVQCMLIDEDRSVYCEAGSGYYDHTRPPSASARRALARLGFTGDGRKGNYRYEGVIGGEAGLWTVADLMLETLYRAYGARPGTTFSADAPLAEEGAAPPIPRPD